MTRAFKILMLGLGIGCLPATTHAATISIDFSTTGSAGDTGSSTYNYTGGGLGTSNPLVVTGLYLKSGSWAAADLFRRKEAPDDIGFGVCNPIEGASCGPGTGDGDINELDNAGQRELIRLMLPVGYTWVSVGVSSLDGSEKGRLFADANGVASTTAGASGDTLITSFTANPADANQSFGIPMMDASAKYLFFEPFDPSGGTNNDFLVSTVTLRAITPTVPEPTSLLLLGSGLAFLVRRRLSA